MPRTAFIVSGRTAITAEMLAHSLITQFEDVTIRRIVLPYIDTPEKSRAGGSTNPGTGHYRSMQAAGIQHLYQCWPAPAI